MIMYTGYLKVSKSSFVAHETLEGYLRFCLPANSPTTPAVTPDILHKPPLIMPRRNAIEDTAYYTRDQHKSYLHFTLNQHLCDLIPAKCQTHRMISDPFPRSCLQCKKSGIWIFMNAHLRAYAAAELKLLRHKRDRGKKRSCPHNTAAMSLKTLPLFWF
ncbi:hypothetical protein KQX54_007507 [Cotesia glomerata]|uniref:Uncharacterized protein n=1 Tax=Cotesia glomerata TaxID=32391 RepID=A0AAV7HWU2_COTGL|nr:hypothetical protein KQX54_007507 [Cotesia glomerata]